MDKTITPQQMTGDMGERLVSLRATEIGFLYHPSGRTEAGIDGYMEIRDPQTGAAQGKILGVQVKTTRDGTYTNETDSSFEYLIDKNDLDYWNKSNIPIIIVLVHLSRNEIFWKRVDLGTGNDGRRLKIDRSEDKFDRSAVDALAAASIKKSTFGVFFPPMRSEENAHMNVVPLRLPEKLYVAAAEFKSGRKALEALLAVDERPRDDWVIRNGIFWSFNDPTKTSVESIIDTGSLEAIETETISLTDCVDDEHTFVDLLRRTLIQQLDNTLNFSPRSQALYFQPTPDTISRKLEYFSLQKNTEAEVVKVYQNQEKDKVLYVRHHAFEPRFWRIGDQWFLSVTPTFVYTWDGYKRDKFEASRLAGKKKKETNAALLGQFIMWKRFLLQSAPTEDGVDLFGVEETADTVGLRFEDPDPIVLPRGVPEKQWAKDEPADRQPLEADLLL